MLLEYFQKISNRMKILKNEIFILMKFLLDSYDIIKIVGQAIFYIKLIKIKNKLNLLFKVSQNR
jgi:hypothetical protein